MKDKKILKKGFLKKAFTSVLVTGFIAYSMASFTACNYDLGDWTKLRFDYVVVEENGKNVLHEVEKWSDSESDSLTVTTSCCDNYIWTSSNKAVLYKNKPDARAYDVACGDHEDLEENIG